jgi:hypothetical protein
MHINYKGKSFVLIMVVIALSMLLLRIGGERILSVICFQNEALAQATLKSIATALDNYARENQGVYPKSVSILTQTEPAYLDRDYVADSPIRGYTYNWLAGYCLMLLLYEKQQSSFAFKHSVANALTQNTRFKHTLYTQHTEHKQQCHTICIV